MTQTGRITYPSALLVTIVISGAVTLFLIAQRHVQTDNNAVTIATVASVPVVTSSVRRVTQSLEELRRNLEIPELSDHVIFFNRVPKCGSEMLVLLMQWLQGANGFRHIRLGGGSVRQLSRFQQVRTVGAVTSCGLVEIRGHHLKNAVFLYCDTMRSVDVSEENFASRNLLHAGFLFG
jgi:hypothetical protein